jgi:hypothetical protein
MSGRREVPAGGGVQAERGGGEPAEAAVDGWGWRRPVAGRRR